MTCRERGLDRVGGTDDFPKEGGTDSHGKNGGYLRRIDVILGADDFLKLGEEDVGVAGSEGR